LWHNSSHCSAGACGEKTFSSILQDDRKVIAPEPSTIVPFPDWMTRKLKAALPGTGVLGLNGPPGSGKRTLLKQVSTIPVQVYWLQRSLECGDLRQLINHLQPTLEGKCVWAVYPASLLSEDLVRKMAQRTWQVRIVLVGDQKIWGLDNNHVIHHKIDAYSTFAREVAVQIGATNEQLQACGGDLRQLQESALMGKYWIGPDTGRSTDKAGHPYFDTQAILNGMDRDPSYYNKAWLEHNVLASTDDLDVCSKFYDQLAFMDEHRWIPGKGGCKEENGVADGHIMSLSLGKSSRALNKVERPYSTYGAAATDGCMDYKAFKKKMKKMAATLEGDDAAARLAQENERYLETAFRRLRKRKRKANELSASSADPPKASESMQDAQHVMMFQGASIKDTSATLDPFKSRPHEIIHCRGFTDALVVSSPSPFQRNAVPLREGEDSSSLNDLLKTKFECKDDLVERMKKLTLLTVSVPQSNVLQIWTEVAKAIALQDADGLNVYAMGADNYLILLHKRDQRKTSGILQLPGFMKRYVGSKAHAANDIKLTGLILNVLQVCKHMPSICTLFHKMLQSDSPFDVVAACRDMSQVELLYHRLEAQMTPDKAKTDLQRALCAGFGTIEKLVKGSGSNKLRDTVRFVTDERIPKLCSYKNFTTLQWGCFHVECEYYDTDREAMLPVTLTTIMNDAAHTASYRKRSIVLKGKTRDGKTYLARSLARMMAIIHQTHTQFESRKFVEITAAEDFKIEGVSSHIDEEVPIVFDDINPGKCMHAQADPLEFMKNLFTVTEARSLYMRNYNANLKKGPKLFTSNSKSIKDWLALRKDQGEVGEEHIKAMNARCVFVHVKSRLYTAEQKVDQDDLGDEDWATAIAERAKRFKSGDL